MRATVIIPSHEHGQLMHHAAVSALSQTIEDLEVLVVLDGADEPTLEAAKGIAALDGRVRVFPNPKGARHGEAHRHTALQSARGRMIAYLSDDDLWFPDHLERLEDALRDADFAHTLAAVVEPDGSIAIPYLGNLDDPWYREEMERGMNFIPLSTAAHTLEIYRALPEGWTPAPLTGPTDLAMWKKFLREPGIRLTTCGVVTVLHFPSSRRREATLVERHLELTRWVERLASEGAWEDVRQNAIAALARRAAELEGKRRRLAAEVTEGHRRLDQLNARLRDLRAHLQNATAERDRAASEAERITTELAMVKHSVAYRAGRRLAGIPIIGPIARWAGRVLAGRAGR